MTVGETIIGFDFDDIIQYHARNLYELFYKRKGQTKDYPLVIRPKKGKPKTKTKRTPEEQRQYRSEITKRYRLRNLEKVRERERIRQKQYRLKRKQEIEEIK